MKRTIRNLAFAAIATAALAGTAMTPVLADAAGKTDQAVEASKSGKANPNLQLSQDGYNVMRDIRAARIAIFNGDPSAAQKYVDLARDDLGKVKTDDKLAKLNSTDDPNLIPVDGQVVVADNFQATPEKAKHIAAGNAHLKKGETAKAMDELKLADVDVGFTRVLMPLRETQNHVDIAYKLVKDEKFYEANMALKAAEDGLNADTVMLVEVPNTDHAKTGSISKSAAPAKPASGQAAAKDAGHPATARK
ncbi:hypothetical protein CSC94_10425 [Zhengella mangrovi]|uniref:YfdX family protein n=1 Tax=Zhengella mangrovi TaxID=1982044 RepID=A0A2G1QN60_9HYPH|nr:YfdX family protein [Zhengella mangrovi]PHP66965.1 hypothetical protein CSC94_10425 [Zhengella mangrovi]